MEMHDFKSAWYDRDRTLHATDAPLSPLARSHGLARTRSSLRPLVWGQALQVLFGLAIVALTGTLWSRGAVSSAVLLAGVVVHVYGIVCIIGAVVVLARLSRVDYAAPVLEIQRQLARVRKAYVVSGLAAGLPWWFLWAPFLVVLCGLTGFDLYAHFPPSTWWAAMGVCAAGLLATWALFRFTRLPAWSRLGHSLHDALTGVSLRRAQAQLEELARFERD